MSGGPVLVGQNPEGAVGLVRWNNPRKDAPELGMGGSFWACPVKPIVEQHSANYADLVLQVRDLKRLGERAKKVIRFLEDRRALYNPHNLNQRADWVMESVIEIRNFLTNEILDVPDDDAGLLKHLQTINAACRQFLDSQQYQDKYIHEGEEGAFFIALDELRSVIGKHIGMIATLYSIEVEGKLGSIIPNSTND